METYSWMRQFADSWMLLAMTLFFLGVILWAIRPGSRKTHQDTSNIPFRNDTTSARDSGDDSTKIGTPQ